MLVHAGSIDHMSLTATPLTWLKRHQAIEPTIRHAKADHRMDRSWLKCSEGDVLHAVLCAAGFNIRWLLRAIARQAAKAIPLVFGLVALYAGFALQAVMRALTTPKTTGAISHGA